MVRVAVIAGIIRRHHEDEPSGPPPHDALPAYLNLTADQKVAWETAHKEFAAEMKAAHERLDQKLTAVLTPEQKAKFDGFQAAMKAIRGDRPGPPPPMQR